MKLQTKLYLFFAGIVLLPLLVVTVTVSILLNRSGTETYQGRLQSGLAAASAIISAQSQVQAGDYQVAIQRIDTGALLAGTSEQRMTALNSLMASAGVTGVELRDATGAVVARAGTDAGNTNAASVSGEGGAIPAESVARTPQLSFSLRLSASDGAIWRLTLLRPFDTEVLSRVFSAQGLEWGLLENGIVGAGSLPAGSEVLDAGGALIKVADRSLPIETTEATVGESSNLGSYLMLAPELTSGPTLLLAAVPAGTVGAASREALAVGLALMLAVAILTGVLGLLLARNISRPLRELTAAAAAGIDGDLYQQVEVRSNDEVGSLASSFVRMQTSIRDYIGELEESRTQLLLALSYTGEILGSTSDRARMMKTTSEAARLATGASGIWVELFPMKRPPGQGAISSGVPAYFFDDAMKAEAVTLAEQVTAGNIPAGELLDFGSGNEAFAYPLTHGHEALGAMVAVFPRGKSVDENRRMLGSLAAQAASAVKNVNFGKLQELLATTDPMTSLFNFRYLCNSLDQEISKSRRYGHPMSVAILDLDDFKAVNDSFGHPAGDELLRSVGEVLATQVRDSDLVARYGGEEFSVVFPETIKSDAMIVVEKLRKGVAAINLPDYPEVKITTSIGVASFPEDGSEKTELLMRADEALYRAKGAGKNRSLAV